MYMILYVKIYFKVNFYFVIKNYFLNLYVVGNNFIKMDIYKGIFFKE